MLLSRFRTYVILFTWNYQMPVLLCHRKSELYFIDPFVLSVSVPVSTQLLLCDTFTLKCLCCLNVHGICLVCHTFNLKRTALSPQCTRNTSPAAYVQPQTDRSDAPVFTEYFSCALRSTSNGPLCPRNISCVPYVMIPRIPYR